VLLLSLITVVTLKAIQSGRAVCAFRILLFNVSSGRLRADCVPIPANGSLPQPVSGLRADCVRIACGLCTDCVRIAYGLRTDCEDINKLTNLGLPLLDYRPHHPYHPHHPHLLLLPPSAPSYLRPKRFPIPPTPLPPPLDATLYPR
jgi:hypothetical protein